MTTLAELYTQISAEIRRGTTLDSYIPAKVQQAVQWLEGLHTFQHMEVYTTVNIGQGDDAASVPSGFKSMLSWRILDNSNYFDIVKIQAQDVSIQDTRRPKGYWQHARTYFYFDSIADQAYVSKMRYNGYSILGTDTSASPTVVQLYTQLIIAATMCLMSPLMRDANVLKFYNPIRDELAKSAIDADVEARQSAEDNSVQYGWEFVEQVNEENI